MAFRCFLFQTQFAITALRNFWKSLYVSNDDLNPLETNTSDDSWRGFELGRFEPKNEKQFCKMCLSVRENAVVVPYQVSETAVKSLLPIQDLVMQSRGLTSQADCRKLRDFLKVTPAPLDWACFLDCFDDCPSLVFATSCSSDVELLKLIADDSVNCRIYCKW